MGQIIVSRLALDGTVTEETIEVADQKTDFDGNAEFLASIKRRAEKLARKGDKAGASYLLSKHGL
jgi:hypothetical protein